MAKTIWTIEKIKEFVEKENYIFLKVIEENGKHSKILIHCKNKNHKPYEVDFNSFYKGARCKRCDVERRMTPYEEIKFYIEMNDYILLSTREEYYNTKKIKIWCGNKKHKPYITKFSAFKNDEKRCRECYIDSLKHDYEYVKTYIELYGYTLLSKEYKNNTDILKMRCPKGHICYMSFKNFYNKNVRCHSCGLYGGELEISRILEKYNIIYECQFVYEDCKNIKPLPFDFYLPKYNILIEFDGIQHYKPLLKYGGKEYFLYRKNNDTIKNIYCQQNNIKLIRIPYWDYKNIEKILIEELNL